MRLLVGGTDLSPCSSLSRLHHDKIDSTACPYAFKEMLNSLQGSPASPSTPHCSTSASDLTASNIGLMHSLTSLLRCGSDRPLFGTAMLSVVLEAGEGGGGPV